jgi:hypothetical protein
MQVLSSVNQEGAVLPNEKPGMLPYPLKNYDVITTRYELLGRYAVRQDTTK